MGACLPFYFYHLYRKCSNLVCMNHVNEWGMGGADLSIFVNKKGMFCERVVHCYFESQQFQF